MKKLVYIVLALVMVMALNVTAFADNYNLNPNGTNISKDVHINYMSTEGADKVYQVVVSWEIQDGVHTTTNKYQWNPDKLQYTKLNNFDVALTTQPGANITIQNRSNAGIEYTLQFDFANAGHQTGKVSSNGEVWYHSSDDNKQNCNLYKNLARQAMPSAAPANYSTEKQASAPSHTIPVLIEDDGTLWLNSEIEAGWGNQVEQITIGHFTLTLYPANSL